MKRFFIPVIIISFLVLLLSVHGKPGNPMSHQLIEKYWLDEGPFELSPERGRFALLYSVVEDKSLIFSTQIARFAVPDLGYANGNYVSLFAPAVSFIAIPGYLIGKYFQASQAGTFATIAVFALVNSILVGLISRKLGATRIPSLIAGIAFLFATPAFTYATTLYQHHVSLFLILTSLYALLKWNNNLSLLLVWLLFAFSIPVDYPNLILMMPLVIWATTRIVWVKIKESKINLNINYLKVLTPLIMVVPLILYVFFSQGSYNKPFQLAGTVTSIPAIGIDGKPTNSNKLQDLRIEDVIENKNLPEKSATGFFQTRNILNGFYIHLISPDRGALVFAPVIFLGILGGFALWRRKQTELSVITAIVSLNVILYSMWGDPWGGWAFGSRYLIPSYALLAVLLGVALTRYKKNTFFIIVFTVLMVYSIFVNSLGAITSISNPPQVEVLLLEEQSDKIERYSYDRNWEFLNTKGSASYFYNNFLVNKISTTTFYLINTGIILVTFAILMVLFIFKKYE